MYALRSRRTHPRKKTPEEFRSGKRNCAVSSHSRGLLIFVSSWRFVRAPDQTATTGEEFDLDLCVFDRRVRLQTKVRGCGTGCDY
jgi:hypothetical protein